MVVESAYYLDSVEECRRLQDPPYEALLFSPTIVLVGFAISLCRSSSISDCYSIRYIIVAQQRFQMMRQLLLPSAFHKTSMRDLVEER